MGCTLKLRWEVLKLWDEARKRNWLKTISEKKKLRRV